MGWIAGRCRLASWGLRATPGALILVYHRVAEAGTDPWALCVSPQHFREQLEVLRRQVAIVSLSRLVRRKEELPQRAVALTFDDGYADNLFYAAPLLSRYDAPATVSVVTGALGREQEFWWDELDRLLLQPGRLPERLRLTVGDRVREWRLGEGARLDRSSWERCRRWRAWHRSPTARHRLYVAIWRLLLPLPAPEQRQLLERLAAWTGTASPARRSRRPLSETELIALTREAPVEVSAHTESHAALDVLPRPAQGAEIFASKARLETLLGRRVVGFAYPFGRYNRDSVAVAREAGFEYACTMTPGTTNRNTSPLELPRVVVGDWSGSEFAARLRRGLAL